MSSRPQYMPFYIGDYLRDTRHLTLEQQGAYVALMLHYWSCGSLPHNDEALRHIVGLSGWSNQRRWESICLALAPLFQPGWRHKRLEEELEKSRILKEKRAFAGKIGGEKNRGRNNNQRYVDQQLREANAKQMDGNHISKSSTLTSTEIGERQQARQEEPAARPRGMATPELEAVILRKWGKP